MLKQTRRSAVIGVTATAIVVAGASAALATPTTPPTVEVPVSETLAPVLHGTSTNAGTGAHSIHFYARTIGSSTWNLLNDQSVTGTDAYKALPSNVLAIGEAFEYQIADCDSSGCATSAVTTGHVSPALGAGERAGATRVPFTIGDKVAAQVDVGSGNLLVTTNQFSLPRRNGASIDVGATFNSVTRLSYANFNGSLAYGWRLSTASDIRLKVNTGAQTVTYNGPNGNVGVFRGTGPTYTAPAGFKMDLSTEPATGGWKLYDHGSGDTMHFSSGGRLKTIIDRNNNTSTFTYVNSVLTTIQTDVGTPAESTLAVTTASGTSRIDKIEQTPDAGSGLSKRSVTYGYDPTSGFLTSITDTLGRTTSFGYGSNNNLNTITAPGGAQTSFTYDTLGRVLTVTQPTADPNTTAVTRFSYRAGQTVTADPNSNQSISIDDAAHTTYDLTSDGMLLVAKATDPAGKQRAATYTPFMDVATSTTPAGTTTASHGANGGESLTGIASPTGAGSSLAYNNSAAAQYQPSGGTDSQGNSSTYTYDGAGNGLSATNGAAASASVTRNPDGTVATSKSPSNAVTAYGYNTVGQQTSMTPPTGNSLSGKTYSYDGFGRLSTVTDGRTITTTYHYDDGDRITKVDYSDNTPSVVYTYDTAGRTDTRVDASGTTSYHYDPLGRLTAQSHSANPGGVSYTYDKVGNLASATNAAGTTTYAYDTRNLLTQLTPANNRIITFTSDDTGRRTDTWFNGTAGGGGYGGTFAAHTHTDYDASSRVARVWTAQNSNDTTRVSDITYSYASPGSAACAGAPGTGVDTGLRWQSTDNVTGKVTSYCYDDANRLVSATTPGGDSWAYTYDANGNRTQAKKNGAVVQTLTVNNADQLTTAGYSYDAAGNLTADTTSSYTYNGADQMTQRTDTYSSAVTSYVYAGTNQNELISQTNRSYTYGRTTKNGLPLVESFTDGSSTFSYIYDPSGTPLVMQGSSTHYLALDGLGSPVALVNQSGATTGTYTYDPYGQTTTNQVGGSAAVNYQLYSFGGGLDDPTSTLEHFGRRWYDPSTGRFTQQDDINTLADPSRANRYEYAGGNPVNYVDPTGRDFGDYLDYIGGRVVEDGFWGGVAGAGAACVGAAAISLGTGCIPAAGPGFVVGAIAGGIYGAIRGTVDYLTGDTE